METVFAFFSSLYQSLSLSLFPFLSLSLPLFILSLPPYRFIVLLHASRQLSVYPPPAALSLVLSPFFFGSFPEKTLMICRSSWFVGRRSSSDSRQKLPCPFLLRVTVTIVRIVYFSTMTTMTTFVILLFYFLFFSILSFSTIVCVLF